MYKDFINKEVRVMVTSHGDNILEYEGIFTKEDENNIALKNASIKYAMVNFQKNFFGNNINIFASDLENVVINKRFIISCNNK